MLIKKGTLKSILVYIKKMKLYKKEFLKIIDSEVGSKIEVKGENHK